MTKQLNLILNGKGGVGKSFFAVNAVQALKDQRRSFRAADTDDENSTLLRFHADAEFVNIQKPKEIDRLFALLESTDLLIVDCRAASTDLFLDYFGEINLREVLGMLDARLTLVTPVNHEADSVEQLRLLSSRLNDACSYVVVKNQAHSEHCRIYAESKTRARIVGELQGREITMSRLHDWLATALNESNVTTGAAECLAFSILWSSRKAAVVEFAGFRWTRTDFCRGWLITGDTGSGKTPPAHAASLPSVQERPGLGRPLH